MLLSTPKKSKQHCSRVHGAQQLCITRPTPAQSRKTETCHETRCPLGLPCPCAPRGEPETPRMHRPTDAEAAQPPQELGAFQEARRKKKPSLLIKHSTNEQSKSSQSLAGGTHPACPPHGAVPRAGGAGSRFPGGQHSICPLVLPCSSLHRHAG